MEKNSALEIEDYLTKRTERASRKQFEEALARIPEREPDEHDRF